MLDALRTRAAALTAAGVFALVTGADAAHEQTASGQSRVNPDARLAVEFTNRVQGYLALHKKAAEGLTKLSKEATPEEIDQHQRNLARALQQLRPKAQPAELFTKEIRAYFRRQLQSVFVGAEGRTLKASIMDENPGPVRVSVNSRYPDTIPLSTMPPQVLASLPKLPVELEYRFIGDRLILLDVPAHLVVDFIEDALPR
jgi:hypothetical protein